MDPPFFYWLTAQYQFTEPHPGWFRDPDELGGEIRYGYLVDDLINARRPNDKYIGFAERQVENHIVGYPTPSNFSYF